MNDPSHTVLGPELEDEVRDFVRKQSALAELQKDQVRLQNENLRDRDAYELSHLRWRRFNDRVRGVWQSGLAVLIVAIVAGLTAVVWDAAQNHDVVIEPFSVPPPLAERGLTGRVVASKLLDRLQQLQNETGSGRAPSSYANDWTGDIKLQVPDTGLSLGQIIHYLDDALGRQTHLSGEVYETAQGVALTIRLAGAIGLTFKGHTLGPLIERAAKAAYRQAQPYRYSVYLLGQGQMAEAAAIEKDLTRTGSPIDRGWAEEALAVEAINDGLYTAAHARIARVLVDIPGLPNAYGLLGQLSRLIGHDESALIEQRRALAAMDGPGRRSMSAQFAAFYPVLSATYIAQSKGDFAAAAAANNRLAQIESGPVWPILAAIDEAHGHNLHAVRVALQATRFVAADPAVLPDVEGNTLHAEAVFAMKRSDWNIAIARLEAEDKAGAAAAVQEHISDSAMHLRHILPLLAYAEARAGQLRLAHMSIAATPKDCDPCLRARGKIAALEQRYEEAARDFQIVSARSPDIPFADTDWGEMLLRQGKFDAAIAKFASAHKKGPHFADPLEMWGEVLIAKNRSDLALAKFAEADKDAPNWGRLHLEWGEALLWSGHRSEAKKQFNIAAHLFLTPAEWAQLEHVEHV
ncbi:MAG: hypothetical protein ACP5QR_08920 [Rhizomicrobium sp.]